MPTQPQTLLPLPMLACYTQVLKSYRVDGTHGTVVRRALLFHVTTSLFLYGGTGVTNCDCLNSAVTLWPDLKIVDDQRSALSLRSFVPPCTQLEAFDIYLLYRYYIALCLCQANWHNIQCTLLILSSKTICDPVTARLL